MPRNWLVLDCNYLCHRAHFAIGGLNHEDNPTGVIYGFLRDIKVLQETHLTNDIIFCFDHGKSLRYDLCPTYKSKRNKQRAEAMDSEKLLDEQLQEQIKLLRRTLLKEIGYRNILYQKGYEADDIIASVVRNNLSEEDTAVIVSSDKDLYQLLSKSVHIWLPSKQKMITPASFRKEFGISPKQWADVKAIAGCNTDDIPGVDGVGEKTAAKFLRGDLNPNTKAHGMICNGLGKKMYVRNLPLVTLPFPGTKVFELQDDEVTKEGWNKVAKRLGMRSLVSVAPPKHKGFGIQVSKKD